MCRIENYSLATKGKALLLVATVVGAVITSLSSLYPALSILALCSLVPFFIYIQKETEIKKSLLVGFLFGISYILPILFPLISISEWSWEETPIFSSFFSGYAWFFIVFLALVFFGGVFYSLYTYIISHIFNLNEYFPFIVTFFWVLFEILRSFLLNGLTWGHIGYSQTYTSYISAWASVSDIYIVSTIVIFCNAILAWIVCVTNRRVRKNKIIFFIGFTVLVVFGGVYIENQRKIPTNSDFSVIAVNLPYTTEQSNEIEIFTQILTKIETALESEPDFLVLPENTFDFFILDRKTNYPFTYSNGGKIKELYDVFLNFSSSYPNTVILVGLHTAEHKKRQYNSLVAYKGGIVITVYDKRALLPFTEKAVPILSGFENVYAEGVGQQVQTIEGVRILPLLCSEAFYIPETKEPVDLVIHSANETIFENTLVAEYGKNMATMRAIEVSAPLVRSVKSL